MSVIETIYQLFLQNHAIQTDTRKIQPGDIFFALKGENFNGNSFAASAIEAGAVAAVIDAAEYAIEGKTILTTNVLHTLQQLALHHRSQLNIPVIAITGSNGKTTTKELLHAVLSSTLTTYTTEGNLNNHIGVPLTILKIKNDAQAAIIEMGANHIGEIASYCTYALPTHGLITNCGKAHLEGFGSLEGVKQAKGELYRHLEAAGGTAFVMWDYEYLQQMSKGIPHIIKYGTHPPATITGKAANASGLLEVAIAYEQHTCNIKTQLVGSYNLPNVLAAFTAGIYFKIDINVIISAIQNYIPVNSRSQLIQKGTNTIILDAYNANPSSMQLAIENFAAFPAANKIVMLGAMKELGAETAAEHQHIIDQLLQNTFNQVVLVGAEFNTLQHPFIQMNSSADAAQWLARQAYENTAILIKGSRSTKMELILQ